MKRRFPQRITFTASLEIDTEGLDWHQAKIQVEEAIRAGDLKAFSGIRATKLEAINWDDDD